MPSVNSDIRFSDMHSSFWDLYCFVGRFVPILHSVDCYIFIVILFLYNTSVFKNYFFTIFVCTVSSSPRRLSRVAASRDCSLWLCRLLIAVAALVVEQGL